MGAKYNRIIINGMKPTTLHTLSAHAISVPMIFKPVKKYEARQLHRH